MASPLPSFDVLMELAQNNPEELEQIRVKLSQEILDEAEPRLKHRLEGLNFRMAMERKRSKNPLQSCIRITALMHDSFDRMRTELTVLVEPIAPNLKLVTFNPAANPINDTDHSTLPQHDSHTNVVSLFRK